MTKKEKKKKVLELKSKDLKTIYYFFDSKSDILNEVDSDFYQPLKYEKKISQKQAEEIKKRKSESLFYEKKKKECKKIILSKYSITNQINILAEILNEFFVNKKVSPKSFDKLIKMCDFVKKVKTEFKTKGSESECYKFKNGK